MYHLYQGDYSRFEQVINGAMFAKSMKSSPCEGNIDDLSNDDIRRKYIYHGYHVNALYYNFIDNVITSPQINIDEHALFRFINADDDTHSCSGQVAAHYDETVLRTKIEEGYEYHKFVYPDFSEEIDSDWVVFYDVSTYRRMKLAPNSVYASNLEDKTLHQILHWEDWDPCDDDGFINDVRSVIPRLRELLLMNKGITLYDKCVLNLLNVSVPSHIENHIQNDIEDLCQFNTAGLIVRSFSKV